VARNRDDALNRIRQAFEAHRRALDELEKALLGGFEHQQPQEDGHQLLTVQQVCQLLGVGRSWVYQRINSGQIPSVQLGGNLRVKREDLDEYIQKHRRFQQTTE
jgi:excisionase family DNA binding protein